MAAFDTNRAYGAAGSAARIGTLFTAAFGGVATWNENRQTRKALSALTDRELDDIGLSRAALDRPGPLRRR